MTRFKHQNEEYRLHRFARARALLWQQRTGKTRAVVESARALFDAFEIYGVVVIAPNGVHRQWADEQIKRWGGPDNNTFAWRFINKNNRRDFDLFMCFTGVRKRLHWLCVNMDVVIRDDVQKAIGMFKKAVGPAMLVIDEAHHFAKPGSKRTGVARGLGRKFEYRRILTGTTADNSPLHTFSQFEILERAALGHSTFGGSAKASRIVCPTCGPRCRGFKHEFADYVEQQTASGQRFPVLDGYKNMDVLKERMARYASVVLRSDCDDLPALMFDHRIVEMTASQENWWNTVKEKELLEAERLGQEKIFVGGAAMVKLQQIEGGFWRHPDGRVEDVCKGENPKMLILLDEIEQYDGQVIVWSEFIHEIDAQARFLGALGIDAGVFHGRAKNRDRDLASFRSGGKRVLLAQPRAGGEGRDMSVARKIVWYSHTFDAIVRNQANERATKMGSGSVQIVDMIAPIGRYCLGITVGKTKMADDISRHGLRKVLETIKEGR